MLAVLGGAHDDDISRISSEKQAIPAKKLQGPFSHTHTVSLHTKSRVIDPGCCPHLGLISCSDYSMCRWQGSAVQGRSNARILHFWRRGIIAVLIASTLWRSTSYDTPVGTSRGDMIYCLFRRSWPFPSIARADPRISAPSTARIPRMMKLRIFT